MIASRPAIPAELERRVLIESGHRCAIPRCKYNRVEIAHIDAWKKVREHKFENLIALCPNCHELYDKDKKIDRKAMLIYKQNLGLLNQRYGEYERRILQFFLEYPDQQHVIIPAGMDLSIFFLIKDSFLLETDIKSAFSETQSFVSERIHTWKAYQLSDSGKLFIQNWEGGVPLD